MKLKYKPEDFGIKEKGKKQLGCQVSNEEMDQVKAHARRLGTDVSKLVYRCLNDAGLFTEPDPRPSKPKAEEIPVQAATTVA